VKARHRNRLNVSLLGICGGICMTEDRGALVPSEVRTSLAVATSSVPVVVRHEELTVLKAKGRIHEVHGKPHMLVGDEMRPITIQFAKNGPRQ
jgi:hypothetical protein